MGEPVFRYRITVDGVDHEVPVDLDFTDLTVEEAQRAARLPADTTDPVELTLTFMFIKVSREIPALDDGDFAAFHQALAPMFSGDSSMIEVVERG